ncbi:hypothetical protein V494_03759 [Pseudogymnoascus sp. VKM F-4513 (FW-928)]|nr:hypothetical protein V494_03759 [Pseudogymnoascus sp. VKM F-4513 (FW-928)]
MGLRTIRGIALQRLIAIIGAVAFLLQGYNQSMMNGLLTLDGFIEVLPQIDTLNTTGAEQAHNATLQGLVVSIYEIGCAFGALSCLFIGDRLGRPKTMLVAGGIALVGGIVQASTYSFGQTVAGRIISGLGVGIYTGTVPMYVSETAEASRRGRLVSIEGAFALGGIALAAWVNFGFFHATGAINYRFPIAFQLLFVIILLSMYPLLPESPRWLVKKERLEEAAVIMSRLLDRDVESVEVAREVAAIHGALQRDKNHKNEYSGNIFSRNKNRHLHRTILACGITMTTQLTGINVIPFFSTTILEGTLGYSGSVARILAGSLNITLAMGGIAAIFLIERFGRRKLMFFSTFSMVVCQGAVCGLSSNLSNPVAAKATLFFYFAAMFSLPIGMFIVPFMYASEIAPLGIRHKVAGLAAATSWFFNFMVAEVTPVAINSIAWKYYIVFTVCSAAGCIVIYFFYPETQGLSLEEIDDIFVQSESIFDTVRVASNLPRGFDALEVEFDEKPQQVLAHVERV